MYKIFFFVALCLVAANGQRVIEIQTRTADEGQAEMGPVSKLYITLKNVYDEVIISLKN